MELPELQKDCFVMGRSLQDDLLAASRGVFPCIAGNGVFGHAIQY
jgi:hypothetical protein